MEGTQEPPCGGRGTHPDEHSSHSWEGGGWELWLGPGPRLDRLGAVLEALGEAEAGPARLADLEDLALSEPPERGRLVLDAELLPPEDLGYLRRFLERTPGFELVLIGDGPGRGGLRRLSARWLAWPPDLIELEELQAEPRGVASHAGPAAHRAAPGPQRTERTEPEPDPGGHERDDEPDSDDAQDGDDRGGAYRPPAHRAQAEPAWANAAPAGPVRGLGAEESRELAAIQAVLDLPPLPGDLEPEHEPAFGAGDQDPFGVLQDVPTLDDEREDGAAPDASELDPFARPHAREPARAREPSAAAPPRARPTAPRTTAAPAASPASPAAPPTYYRAQIADLADIAQRVDLALRALRPEPDRAAPPDDGYEPLAGEVARLLQFTRTLSYLSGNSCPLSGFRGISSRRQYPNGPACNGTVG
jgi:hypothetical protein